MLQENSRLKIFKEIREGEAIEEDAVVIGFEEDYQVIIARMLTDGSIRKLRQGTDKFSVVD